MNQVLDPTFFWYGLDEEYLDMDEVLALKLIADKNRTQTLRDVSRSFKVKMGIRVGSIQSISSRYLIFSYKVR